MQASFRRLKHPPIHTLGFISMGSALMRETRRSEKPSHKRDTHEKRFPKEIPTKITTSVYAVYEKPIGCVCVRVQKKETELGIVGEAGAPSLARAAHHFLRGLAKKMYFIAKKVQT